jgi:gliding motility-associated-like protein
MNRFIRVAYPNGHENILPPTSGNPQTITWDAFATTGTFTLEYSADSGITWNNISSGLNNNTRYFTWNNAPSTLSTRKALIRITNGTARDVSDTTFHIFLKANQPSAVTCDRQIHLFWPRTTGATRYRVLQNINSFMEPIGTTTDTFFTVFNLVNGRPYWFSLQAIGVDGQTGPRTNGVSFTPTATPVPPSIFDQPDTVLICENSKLNIISGATGTAPFNRQWQFSSDNGKTWQNSSGATKDTLSFVNFPWSQNGYLYRNRYFNVCRNHVFTRPALIRVDTPVRFNNKLRDTTLCEGDSLKLSVSLSFNGQIVKQWQRSLNGGATWNDLSGDTFNQIRRTGLMFADNQSQFRMVVSNVCHTRKPSNTAVLTMRAPLRLNAPKDTIICKGVTLSLTAKGTGGDTSAYIYSWNGFSPGKTISVTPLVKTTYTVSLDDKCSYNDAFDTIVIDVRPGLSLAASNDTTICMGRSARLNANLGGGFAPTYNYSWSPGNLSGSSIVVSPVSTTTYRLKATDGCTPDSVIRNIKVTVRPALDLQMSKDTLICNGRQVNLQTLSAGGLGAGYTINWNLGLGAGANKVVSPITKTTYRAILTDACTVKPDTAFVTVDVRAPLQLKLNNDTIICKGRSVQLSSIVNGGLSTGHVVSWNQGLGNGLTHTVTPLNNIQYVAVLSDGCTVKSDTQRINVTVRPELDVKTNADTTLCYGNSIILNNSSTGGTGSYSYIWQNTALPNPSLGSSSVLNLTPLNSLKVRVIISDGCTVKSDTATVQITVLPDLTMVTSKDTSICSGTQASLRARSSGGTGNYKYTWVILPTNSNVGNDSTLVISPASTSTYSVSVEDACTVTKPSKNIVVTVVNMPNAALYTADNEQCDPAEFVVKNNSNNSVRYSLNGKNYSGNDTLLKFNTGLYNVQLKAFNSLGCEDTSSLLLLVHPSPKAGFSINPNPPRENDQVNFTDLSSGADFWNWFLPHGNFASAAVLPWPANDTGAFYLKQVVSNNFGCFDSASMTVKVGPGFYLHIPTAFTPDANGVNDVWLPRVHGVRNYRLQIFNRWGQLVFSSNDPSKGWDGLNAPQGYYAYMISGISSYEVKILETGSLTLLR